MEFLIKRDDLIHHELSGNKARKIYYYLNSLKNDSNIKTIVSYGSIQSNAMYSLSYFAKEYGLDFYYYANHIPSLLKKSPRGNLKLALDNKMILKEGYKNIPKLDNALYIKEGIAQKEAYFGIKQLALELIEQLGNKEYQIFLPSGTGTTALFLSKAFYEMGINNIEVFTTPCVGSIDYLKEQFRELEENETIYPNIVDTKKRYHFGKLYRDFYLLWLELHKKTSIEFDLLYDMKGWIAIFENIDKFSNLVYIHQGGLIGNISMLERYKRKYEDLK